jgi:glutamate N-acetyltransferase/amino-acid N-acetyltransferase
MQFTSADEHRQWLSAQAALPRGFRVGTTRFSFEPAEVPKRFFMNLTLLALARPTPDFAAVFTRNAFPGAPVVIGRRRLQEPTLGAVLVNNKISNVCAPGGVETSERLCAALAAQLGLRPGEVLPSSTGVIGWGLPAEAMCGALPAVTAALQSESILPAALGIMTTDLYPKIRRADLGGGAIVGIAKGAGMIEPNLATMLVYILTDIAVPRAALRQMLPVVVGESFNSISIDSDQSTSDTVVALSSGQVEGVAEAAFREALGRVCRALAEDVVRNGEGVHHVMKVTVQGAPETGSEYGRV